MQRRSAIAMAIVALGIVVALICVLAIGDERPDVVAGSGAHATDAGFIPVSLDLRWVELWRSEVPHSKADAATIEGVAGSICAAANAGVIAGPALDAMVEAAAPVSAVLADSLAQSAISLFCRQ